SIDLVIGAEVNPAASNHASVPLAGAAHQFVRTAASVNDGARVAVVAVYTLVACNTGYPYNHGIRSVSRCYPRRSLPTLTHAPGAHDRGWIRRRNFIGGDRARIVMKTKICSLACVISDSRCPSVNPSHVRLGHGRRDAAEVVTVHQIGVAIFAQAITMEVLLISTPTTQP